MIRNTTAVVLALAAAAAWVPARAVLGGDRGSIAADAAALSAASTAEATRAGYAIHTLHLANGTVLDQYVSTSGTVFALAWHGPRPPQLVRLLGAYFPEYQAASTRPHRRDSQMRLDSTNLVYRSGGHMRAYWGVAYAPALAPAGVDLEHLQ
jgi:hypothetical protein